MDTDEFDFLPMDFPSHYELVRWLAQRLGRVPTLAEVAALRGVMVERVMRRKARKTCEYQDRVAARRRAVERGFLTQRKKSAAGDITGVADDILADIVFATAFGLSLSYALHNLQPILNEPHADPDDEELAPEDWKEEERLTDPEAITRVGQRLYDCRHADNPSLSKGLMMPTGMRWRTNLAYIRWKASGGAGEPPPAARKKGLSQLITALANRTGQDGLQRMLQKAESADTDMQRRELLELWECLGAAIAIHPRYLRPRPGPGDGDLDLPPPDPDPEPDDPDDDDDILDSTRLGLPQPPSPQKP